MTGEDAMTCLGSRGDEGSERETAGTGARKVTAVPLSVYAHRLLRCGARSDRPAAAANFFDFKGGTAPAPAGQPALAFPATLFFLLEARRSCPRLGKFVKPLQKFNKG